jgi:thiol-disulfide isomerase/thioredoxin
VAAAIVTIFGPPPASATSVFSRFITVEPSIAAPISALTGPSGTTTLRDFAGRFVLVHFWATWCAPCITELPSLEALQRRQSEKDFVILAVSTDRADTARVERFTRELGLERVRIYHDRLGLTSNAFNVRSLPSSFLVNPDGRLVGRLDHAADWTSGEAAAFLDSWIDRYERSARETGSR